MSTLSRPTFSVGSSTHTLIIADIASATAALQQSLARLGYSSALDKCASFESAVQAVRDTQQAVGRVLVVLEPDPKRGLEVLRQIREVVSAPLYAIGRRDAGLILDAVDAGADNFIEDTEPLDYHVAKALSREKTFAKNSNTVGKLVCVTSARGGSGGSLTAVNLAVAMAERTKRVALCDFDFQNGVCDALLDLKPKHTIIDLGRCLENLDNSSVEMTLMRHPSGVHLLPAPAGPFDAQIPIAEICQSAVRTLRQMFPLVVVDLPRLNSGFDPNQILSVCDQIVLVTPMEFNSMRSAARELSVLEEKSQTPRKTHVVGNRNGQPYGLSVAEGEVALRRKLSHLIPDDPKTANRSINCGIPYVLACPGSQIGKAINSLADTLLKELDLGWSRKRENSVSIQPLERVNTVMHQCADWLRVSWVKTN